MPSTSTGSRSLLDAIPEPQAVRAHLSQLACEATVLRILLRAAECKAKYSARRRPPGEEATDGS
jgi:hypothetical protein